MSQANVTVRRTNTFRALLDRLRGVKFGCYIVWIHNYEVSRIAAVDHPENIQEIVRATGSDESEKKESKPANPAPKSKPATKRSRAKSDDKAPD